MPSSKLNFASYFTPNNSAIMFGENSIEIFKFEVFEKGKGIGSEIITEVLKKSKDKEIYLYAEDVYQAWNYLGDESPL